MGRCFIVVGILALGALRAQAHDPSLSTVDLHLGKEEMSAQLIFVAGEILAAIPKPDWKQVAREAFDVQFDGQTSTAQDINVEMTEEGEARLKMIFPRSAGRRLVIGSLLIGKLGNDHRQFVVLVDDTGKVLAKQLLTASDNTLEVMLPPGNVAAPKPLPSPKAAPGPLPAKASASPAVAPSPAAAVRSQP